MKFVFSTYRAPEFPTPASENTSLVVELDDGATVAEVTMRFLAFMSAAYGYDISPTDLVNYFVDEGYVELEIMPEGE